MAAGRGARTASRGPARGRPLCLVCSAWLAIAGATHSWPGSLPAIAILRALPCSAAPLQLQADAFPPTHPPSPVQGQVVEAGQRRQAGRQGPQPIAVQV